MTAPKRIEISVFWDEDEARDLDEYTTCGWYREIVKPARFATSIGATPGDMDGDAELEVAIARAVKYLEDRGYTKIGTQVTITGEKPEGET